ncbi:MAG: DNA-3-methyladenine glycosylase I [Ruminococcaceae bacterium]|nr:DNA-3-methyladenine glycosylase I [Oscillospiraceae bacterium]
MADVRRCPWAKGELDQTYHDHEWGVPQHDDQKLFELLILEGMQAGLTWSLILKRREHMREVFSGFDPVQVAQYDDAKKAALLGDPGVIRNRAKINALVDNARAFLEVQREYGSFDAYIWEFVDGAPVQNAWQTIEDVPAFDETAAQMSKALKKRGFRFVGPTICYAFMQAAGLVNDHLVSCDFYKTPGRT